MIKNKIAPVLLALILCLCAVMASCGDTDSDTDAGSITSIRLTYEDKVIPANTLTVNLSLGTVTFTVDIQPEGSASTDFTISSSDTDVATADGLTFTLLAMGQTTVTITANSDSIITNAVTLNVLEEASVKPYNITNNFAQDSSTGLMVLWHNDSSLPIQALQIVAEAGSFDNARTIFVPGIGFETSGDVGTFLLRNIFKTEVNGLSPGARYKYRMGSIGAWSDEFIHVTSGGANKDFSFTVISDPQNDTYPETNSNGTMIATMNAAIAYDEDNRFFINCGDLTERIGNTVTSTGKSEIVNYTEAANRYNTKTPIAATQGNHDAYYSGSGTEINWDEATVFNAFVTFPDNGFEPGKNPDKSKSYYFYYNNVLFIMLNTIASIYDNTDEKAQWLEQVLKNDKDNNLSKYRIVATHIGAFGNHYYENGNIVKMRSLYGKIFTDYDVDIVFSGHDHTYSRSNPMKLGENTAITEIDFGPTNGGTIFNIAGATGPKTYNTATGEITYLDQVFPVNTKTGIIPGFFVNVKVTADILTVTARRMGSQTDFDMYFVEAKR